MRSGPHVKKEDVESLMNVLEVLLTQVNKGKRLNFSSFDLLSSLDKQKFQSWYSDMPAPLSKCMHILIEEQAQLYPTHEAVCAYDGSFSYAELNQRSSVLAAELLRRGVTLGSCVPLMFEKSKWHIVALIAVRL